MSHYKKAKKKYNEEAKMKKQNRKIKNKNKLG